MSKINVFFVEQTGKLLYTHTFKCSDDHLTRVEKGEIAGPHLPDCGDWDEVTQPCATCGNSAKLYSTGGSTIYRRPDTGEILGGRHKLPPGACYDANWTQEYEAERCGPDGRRLTVVCPDGFHWCIDSHASNCSKPKDNAHRCWVRHGRPEDGTLHVDKNGLTCEAGAGSIQTPKWHGYLHNGFLSESP